MTDQAREAIELLLKNRQLDNRQSYLVRGRRYEKLPDDDLRSIWAEQMTRWADESPLFDQKTLNDLGVEMKLREMAPPLELIAEARLKILAKSGMAFVEIVSGYQRAD